MTTTAPLPIDLMLAALAEGAPERSVRNGAAAILAKLEAGVPLDSAVRELAPSLPATLRQLLTGPNAESPTNDLLNVYFEMQQSLRTSRTAVWQAAFYPLSLLVALLMLACLFSSWILPQFESMFNDFELELPVMTQWTLQAAPGFATMAIAVLVVLLVLAWGPRLVGLGWFSHRVRAALPGVGRLWVCAGQQQFAELLGAQVARHIPLPAAMSNTAELLPDRNVGRAVRLAQPLVEHGVPLSSALAGSLHFTPESIALVHWGEQSGELAAALRLAADHHAAEFERRSTQITRYMPPLTILLVGALILVAVISLFVPLVKLVEALS